MYDDKLQIITYEYKNKIMRTLKNKNEHPYILDLDDTDLMKKYMIFNYGIISCFISIYESDILNKKKYIYNDIDVFPIINQFIIYNSTLHLCNNNKNIFLALLKDNINELKDIDPNKYKEYNVEWHFMEHTFQEHSGENITLKVSDGITIISIKE